MKKDIAKLLYHSFIVLGLLAVLVILASKLFQEVFFMGATSTASKSKYNKKAYENFNVRLKPELFERINEYCRNNNLSRSQFLQLAIDKLNPDETSPE